MWYVVLFSLLLLCACGQSQIGSGCGPCKATSSTVDCPQGSFAFSPSPSPVPTVTVTVTPLDTPFGWKGKDK